MVSIKEKNQMYTHKCVQCGSEIKYSKWGQSYCIICKASQTVRTLDNKTSIPFTFLFGGSSFGRVTYHTRITNLD